MCRKRSGTVEDYGMGYMTDGLTFNALRGANRARLPQFKNGKGEPAHSKPDGSDWCLAQWCNAVTGELGEAANLIKKIGVERVEALEVHEIKKWNCELYKAIEVKYKTKLKQLETQE